MKKWALSLPRFDGPLDLLLSLVRRQEIDLADLPVAEITRQYLEYIRQAEDLDVNLGAEYADMAATLIQLKSRMLLPRDPELAEREPDPRQELVRQLLDYEQVRQAAEFLRQKLELAEASHGAPAGDEFAAVAVASPGGGGTLNVQDILSLAQRALQTARQHQTLTIEEEPGGTEVMMHWAMTRLACGDRDVQGWFAAQPTRLHQAGLFLALLEMVRRGLVRVSQTGDFGEIRLG